MATMPEFAGLLTGQGFNATTQQIHAQAIVHDGLESMQPDGTAGQAVELYLTRIENSEQLASHLGVSASASYKSVGFSASAEVNYLSDFSMKRYSTYFFVNVQVRNSSEVLRNPRLKPEAKAFLEENGWDRFEEVYGPDFVAGFISGGSYRGLIEVLTESQEQRRALTAKLKASGWGANVKAQIDSKIERITSGFEKRVTVLQRGGISGGQDRVIEIELEEMIQQARRFPEDVRSHPLTHQIIFNQYRAITPIADLPVEDKFVQQQRAEVLVELNRKYLYYKDLRTDIDFVRRHMLDFEEFQSLDEAALEAQRQELEAEFALVTEQVETITKHIRTCRSRHDRLCQLPEKYHTVRPN